LRNIFRIPFTCETPVELIKHGGVFFHSKSVKKNGRSTRQRLRTPLLQHSSSPTFHLLTQKQLHPTHQRTSLKRWKRRINHLHCLLRRIRVPIHLLRK
jgi:hypothetical protein